MPSRSAFILGPVLGLMLAGCAHRAPLTIITTRQNGTVKICGPVKTTSRTISGESPEGSRISVNVNDVVTTDQNGTCKK